MAAQKLYFLGGTVLILGMTALVANFWVHETTGDQSHTLALQEAIQNVIPPRDTQFDLVDHTGVRVTEQTYRGRLMLVYFGYTSCVDICPYDLAAVAGALDLLDIRESEIQPLFVTIDPKVDTQAVLADYVTAYHPQIVGLTGTLARVTAAAKSYGASFEKEQIPSFTGHGHSSNLYLIGRDGKFLRALRTPTTGEVIASIIELYL
jgi:cytochrome oxidase Cu insertion factor (SCO1/SenC/PrrC family)